MLPTKKSPAVFTGCQVDSDRLDDLSREDDKIDFFTDSWNVVVLSFGRETRGFGGLQKGRGLKERISMVQASCAWKTMSNDSLAEGAKEASDGEEEEEEQRRPNGRVGGILECGLPVSNCLGQRRATNPITGSLCRYGARVVRSGMTFVEIFQVSRFPSSDITAMPSRTSFIVMPQLLV